MNRLSFVLIATILVSFTGLKAQQEGSATLVNYQAIEAKLKRSDSQIEHPKKGEKAKTWLNRASVMQEIYEMHNKNLVKGMTPVKVQIVIGNPAEKEAFVKDGVNVEIHKYEHVNVKYINGVLDSFEEVNKFVEAPLTEAYNALKKAMELDTDGKSESKISKKILELIPFLEFQGVQDIQQQNFGEGTGYFKMFIDLSESEKYSTRGFDTTIYYFTAYSSFLDKNFKDAITYGEPVREHNYPEPYNYYLLTKSYFEVGDSTTALNVLQEGFDKYPENEYLINQLINYYLIKDEAESALKFIGLAKKSDADNPAYYFAEGSLYENLEKTDEAIEAYKTAIKKDPEFFNAYFNLSVLYYNQAVALLKEANDVLDDKKYEAMKEKAMMFVNKALEPMEQALKLEPESREVHENLKTFYFRVRSQSDEYEARYNEIIEKLKTLD